MGKQKSNEEVMAAIDLADRFYDKIIALYPHISQQMGHMIGDGLADVFEEELKRCDHELAQMTENYRRMARAYIDGTEEHKRFVETWLPRMGDTGFRVAVKIAQRTMQELAGTSLGNLQHYQAAIDLQRFLDAVAVNESPDHEG